MDEFKSITQILIRANVKAMLQKGKTYKEMKQYINAMRKKNRIDEELKNELINYCCIVFAKRIKQ